VSKALRVILLTSSYPQGANDSSSGFLYHLSRHLAHQGVAMHILAPSGTTAGTERDGGVTITRFRYLPLRWQKLAYGSGILPNLRRNPLLWLQVPFFMLAMTASLLHMRLKVRPHLIHAHWVLPQGLIAVMACFLTRTPVVVSVHGTDAFGMRGRLLSTVKRFCLRHCNAWTSNTRATAKAVSQGRVLPSPRIIPMGVDTEHFGSGSRHRLRDRLVHVDLIILFVGRLIENKGIVDLIRAFAQLPTELREKTNLWIIGQGEMESSLKTLTTELSIGDRIVFWGEIPNDQLPDYYAAADLFVGPSVETPNRGAEGQGIVFIEAFAADLCVLATRVGGIPEVVDDGRTGMLVSPRNPTELANAMQRLLSDPALRQSLANNARVLARERYAWKKIASEFVALYREITTNRNGE